eukprot:COSAG06_NODE_4379_length_4314_cov_10.994543_2_plen_123_part_00
MCLSRACLVVFFLQKKKKQKKKKKKKKKKKNNNNNNNNNNKNNNNKNKNKNKKNKNKNKKNKKRTRRNGVSFPSSSAVAGHLLPDVEELLVRRVELQLEHADVVLQVLLVRLPQVPAPNQKH